MGGYHLTKDAEGHVDGIYEYSLLTFGTLVADRYLDDLYAAFSTIAETPSIGAAYPRIYAGLHRYVIRSHSIYYLEHDDHIEIVAILHNRRDPARYF